MKKMDVAFRVGAIASIWVLITVGILAGAAVPLISAGLSEQYTEYSKDFWVITGLLIVPVLLAETLLAVILVLMRRIRKDQMFSPAAHRWVRVLSYNSAALSLSFASILAWLNAKNTLPPVIGLALLTAIFLPLAVALVTRTLLGLLKKATEASEELQGVI